MYTITEGEFERFQKLIYITAGIHVSEKKKTMIQGRLQKRLNALGIESYAEYYDYLIRHPEEKELFIEHISTHVTEFFREKYQWNFFEEYLKTLSPGRMRIWSAACSTGEEPYSIAMFLKEHLNNFEEWDIKILATDIAHESLKKAFNGIYGPKSMVSVPEEYKKNYFESTGEKEGEFKINKELRKMILFREFNLIYGDFSLFKNTFDIIFCRNVMIYFDAPTRHTLVEKLSSVMSDRGVLFLGHSESVMGEIPEIRFCESSIYQKVSGA